MTSMHFIALANMLKRIRPESSSNYGTINMRCIIIGQKEQWDKTVEAIADFCEGQNENFNRERFLDFIERNPNAA